MAEHEPGHETEHQPKHRHETRDVPLRPFVFFIMIMAVGAVLMHIGLGVLSGVFHKVNIGLHGTPAPIALGPTEPPTPALLLSNKLYNESKQSQNMLLNEYRWMDQKQGFVAIPIERAMDIVATRGLPDWRNETDFRYW